MKICLTGGAGLIGSHLTDRLIELGHQVVVVDNLSSGDMKNVHPKANFIGFAGLDICNKERLEDVFKEHKFDYVFHLAAQIDLRKSFAIPSKDAQINIIGSLNLIELAAQYKIKKFIFSSTGGAIYSPEAELPCTENSLTSPMSPYGLGKLTIEKYLQIFKEQFGLDFVALRYANVYGPRQGLKNSYSGVISIFIKNILNRQNIKIFGDGEQTRTFVSVHDIINANIKAADLSGIYNVSSNQETSINELALKLIDLMQAQDLVKIEHVEAVKGELKRSLISSEKLMKTGWQPQVTLEEGLRETIDYFKRL